MMVEQAVRVSIPDRDMDLIRRNAREAEIGGASHIRRHDDRQETLAQDQLVGQICHYAAIKFLAGSIEGYIAAREVANENKYKGDGGRDVPGFPIDIKGSLIRGERALGDHRLLVRPRERRDGWIYVMALVESLDPPVIWLMGWAKDSDLPEADADGRFQGAHSLWADELRPMVQLQKAVQRTIQNRSNENGEESGNVPTTVKW